MMDLIDVALNEHFGLSSFRNGQKEIIQAFLNGQDVVALLPTGTGKSLCFQLPCLMKPGLMIVISPLIALMDDQAQEWKRFKSPYACASFHSHLSRQERHEILSKIQNDSLKLLLLSPESLQNSQLQEILRHKKLMGLVIDEAHCIYQWGKTFRPDYLNIRQYFADTPMMLLSATLRYNEWIWIKRVFKLDKTFMWISKMQRRNLKFKTQICWNKENRLETFLNINKDLAGIIYVRTRKEASELSSQMNCYCYHAGLDKEQRRFVHRQFRQRMGVKVVATMAFGMGVNRGDIRFVYHYGLPYSLTHYAQEAGRAGRDGDCAQAIISYSCDELWPDRWKLKHFEILLFLFLGPLRSWYLAQVFEHKERIAFLKLRLWLKSKIDEFWKR